MSTVLGYELVHTSPYTPQGNGMNERTHRTINNMLRTLIHQKGKNWPYFIPAIQLNLNTHIKLGQEYSPYEIVFGKMAKLPVFKGIETYTIPGEPDKSYMNRLKEQLQTIHNTVPTRQEEPKEVHQERWYKLYEKILVRTTPQQKTHKLVPPWQGPFVIVQTPNRFQVKYQKDNGHIGTAHVKDIKLWTQNKDVTKKEDKKVPTTVNQKGEAKQLLTQEEDDSDSDDDDSPYVDAKEEIQKEEANETEEEDGQNRPEVDAKEEIQEEEANETEEEDGQNRPEVDAKEEIQEEANETEEEDGQNRPEVETPSIPRRSNRQRT